MPLSAHTYKSGEKFQWCGEFNNNQEVIRVKISEINYHFIRVLAGNYLLLFSFAICEKFNFTQKFIVERRFQDRGTGGRGGGIFVKHTSLNRINSGEVTERRVLLIFPTAKVYITACIKLCTYLEYMSGPFFFFSPLVLHNLCDLQRLLGKLIK